MSGEVKREKMEVPQRLGGIRQWQLKTGMLASTYTHSTPKCETKDSL